MPKKTTISQIAQMAGVSTASVSFVLNGKAKAQKLLPETVAKIKRVMTETGYRPSYMAQSLSRGRTKCIAYICGAIYPEFIGSLIDAAEDNGYQLISMLTRWNLKKERACVEKVLQGMADAMIVNADVFNSFPSLGRKVADAKIPVVLVNSALHDGFPSVQYDFNGGMGEAFDVLSGKGYRNIALIVQRKPGKQEAYLRLCGKFSCEPLLFDIAEDMGEKALTELCQAVAGRRPDALLVEDGGLCMKVLDGLSSLDFKVGRDFSAICIDGAKWLDFCHLPIAIIDYDLNVGAMLAVRSALAMLDGKTVPDVQSAKTFLRREEFIFAKAKFAEVVS